MAVLRVPGCDPLLAAASTCKVQQPTIVAMVQFGLTLQQTLDPEWEAHYLHYDALKDVSVVHCVPFALLRSASACLTTHTALCVHVHLCVYVYPGSSSTG